MNWSICDDSSSSSDDDVQPILPSPSSSGNLSTIEESHLENGVDSSSSSSHYSSVNSGSISNISILSKDVLQNAENSVRNENDWKQSRLTVNNRRHSDGAINFVEQIHEVNRIVSSFNRQDNQSNFTVFPEVVVSFFILFFSTNFFKSLILPQGRYSRTTKFSTKPQRIPKVQQLRSCLDESRTTRRQRQSTQISDRDSGKSTVILSQSSFHRFFHSHSDFAEDFPDVHESDQLQRR